MKPVNEKRKSISRHTLIIGALSFVLTLTLMEIILYFIQTVNLGFVDFEVDATFIMLYVIPVFSFLITAFLIYLNHRTLQTTNRLTAALNKVAEGDYNVTIPVKRVDSFNSVYVNFNKMTAELKSVKVMREDFVHDFSHEFKTPLASINGFANLLLDGNLTEEEQRSIIKIIADESARLSNLSENVLIQHRIQSQQLLGESKPFRLDLQIIDCIILLQRQWEAKSLTVAPDLKPVTYIGDEQLLKQVWLNLLSNAIKFTPDGGEISVTLTTEGNKTVAEVSDNGIGIAPENLPKIFDRYYQVSNGKGNGLGLSICKRICELCGGTISAKSEVGKGSTFTVRI